MKQPKTLEKCQSWTDMWSQHDIQEDCICEVDDRIRRWKRRLTHRGRQLGTEPGSGGLRKIEFRVKTQLLGRDRR